MNEHKIEGEEEKIPEDVCTNVSCKSGAEPLMIAVLNRLLVEPKFWDKSRENKKYRGTTK